MAEIDFVTINGRKYEFLGSSGNVPEESNKRFKEKLRRLSKDSEFSRLQKTYSHKTGLITLSEEGLGDEIAYYWLRKTGERSGDEWHTGSFDANDGRVFDDKIEKMRR